MDLLDELTWRGLVHQCTDEPGLREHLASGRRRIYVGFDPTADSLTIGNLVPIMLLRHVRRAGHDPVVVMGGGTGLIGDPSGKSDERQLLSPKQVEANINAQRQIFLNLLGEDVAILNNHDWLKGLGYIEALRDVGKYFSINMMMCKESVRSRLENREQGITYTEFSYMILQAYDFAHLYKAEGVTVQCGGSDQFGNIVAGIDLIRRKLAVAFGLSALQDRENPDMAQLKTAVDISKADIVPTFGLTAPLVTKSDGGKFGKTESGAIWLTPERTSPYAYYQFWLNTSDVDVGAYLRTFTLLDREEIERLEAEVLANPGQRQAQRRLAHEATALLHGQANAVAAEQASKALFSGQIRDLPASMLADVFAGVPSSEHPRSLLDAGVGMVDVLVETGLAKSKREAREFLGNGSVRVNGDVVGLEARLSADDVLAGSLIAIRRGKKKWHLTRWV